MVYFLGYQNSVILLWKLFFSDGTKGFASVLPTQSCFVTYLSYLLPFERQGEGGVLISATVSSSVCFKFITLL